MEAVMTSQSPIDAPLATIGLKNSRRRCQSKRLKKIREAHQSRVTRIKQGLAASPPPVRRSASTAPHQMELGPIRAPNDSTLPTNDKDNDLTEAEKLSRLQEKVGYTFSNLDFARAALGMIELSDEHHARELKAGISTSCQNLAILGDLVLELAMADKWFEIASTPQTWSATQSRVAPNAALAVFCRNSGLHECYGRRHHAPNSIWQRATLVEAVLGAIYQDSGKSLAAVQSAMECLGILQAGMKALESAETQREARKARKARKAHRQIMIGPKNAPFQKPEKMAGEKRIIVEISDDDQDQEEVSMSESDDTDENYHVRSGRSGNCVVPGDMKIEVYETKGTTGAADLHDVTQNYVDRDGGAQEGELGAFGDDEGSEEVAMDTQPDGDAEMIA